jgi:hypothetical protein
MSQPKSVIVLASAARTTLQNVPIDNNGGAKYMDLVIDITAYTAGSLTVTVQGVDPASGKKYTILASAALAAVATTVLRIGPALTAAANVAANYSLPAQLNVSVAVGDATSITYSIGASLTP